MNNDSSARDGSHAVSPREFLLSSGYRILSANGGTAAWGNNNKARLPITESRALLCNHSGGTSQSSVAKNEPYLRSRPSGSYVSWGSTFAALNLGGTMPSRVYERSGVGVLEVSYKGNPVEFLIDAQDVPLVSGHHWWTPNSTGYAATREPGKRGDYIFLHRLVMGLPTRRNGGLVVDHISGDRQDNRKKNLRVVTHAENCQNRPRLASNNTSGYRGVCYCKKRGKWQANAKKDGRFHWFGYFDTAEEAADAASRGRARLMPGTIEGL